jgi:hypothetical protein
MNKLLQSAFIIFAVSTLSSCGLLESQIPRKGGTIIVVNKTNAYRTVILYANDEDDKAPFDENDAAIWSANIKSGEEATAEVEDDGYYYIASFKSLSPPDDYRRSSKYYVAGVNEYTIIIDP